MTTTSTVGEKDAVGIDEANVTISQIVRLTFSNPLGWADNYQAISEML
jgi:hypothetical protein